MSALLPLVWLVASLPHESLAIRLLPLIQGHRGEVAVAVKHLRTGETFFHNADQMMPTASLIKFPVMIEYYQQVQEGRIRPQEMVRLREIDKVPGSGILTEHFSAGTTFPLADAVRLMIVFSDNTATNLVLDRIGLESTNHRLDSWGYVNTRIYAKLFRSQTALPTQRSREFGLGSTTAREMVHLFEKLHEGKLVSPEASKAMLDHLKACEDRERMPRLLPDGTVVAHKTGTIEEARTDGGIIYTPSGPVVLCVLTNKNSDKSWKSNNEAVMLCARVAKEVYDHFAR
jgi:beta-lactamase class A